MSHEVYVAVAAVAAAFEVVRLVGSAVPIAVALLPDAVVLVAVAHVAAAAAAADRGDLYLACALD